ncbi:MAG TPA: iron uptake system protein EfeO [Angustibacter sp.]|nr:iron uptake system protein EfeO [Angustibacter sp.]
MPPARVPLVAGALAASLLALTACGDDASSAAAGATTVKVTATDDGCTAEPASSAAGPVTFEVTNRDARRVTEVELLRDGKILAEKENLTPGLSGTFTLRLDAGDYVVLCPNAATEQSTFTVRGAAGGAEATTAAAGLDEAVSTYRAYLLSQTASLVKATTEFTAAVKAGDVERAKALYAPTRSWYERIEPVAETFGDLDPRIDARVNDVDPSDEWTGFHRIEKALWADRSLSGMAPVADQLLADVRALSGEMEDVELSAAQIANGAVGLLDEVAKSKVTGEEERYSHTDLWDFAANLAGARQAFDVLGPVLRLKQAALLEKGKTQFADVEASLARYRTGDGYRDYSAVTDEQRRTMTTQVNALAETLSKIAPLVA